MQDYIFLEEADSPFPPTHLAQAEPNGLLAIGGDLTPRRILDAYSKGIFPWFNPGDPILWWTPNPRCILQPAHLRISTSLHKLLKKRIYTVTFDQAFTEVITACGQPRKDAPESWIQQPMIDAYTELNKLGYAHSIEVWRDQKLVGGLYGVSIGRVFFGESMFSREANTSKIALVHLARQLGLWNFPIIDCQVTNNHLLSLGAEEISRNQFEKILLEYKVMTPPALPWVLDWRYG